MRNRIGSTLGMFLGLGVAAHAFAAAGKGDSHPPAKSACSTGQFLRAFVGFDRSLKRGSRHHFYPVPGDAHPEGMRWHLWLEGHRVLLIPDVHTKDGCRTPLLQARHNLDLRTDILPAGQDVGSSTYLETRAWGEKTVFDAVVSGTPIVVTRP